MQSVLQELVLSHRYLKSLFLGSVALTFIFALNYTSHHIAGVGLLKPANSVVWISFIAIMLTAILYQIIEKKFAVSKIHFLYLAVILLLLAPSVFHISSVSTSELFLVLALIAGLLSCCLFSQEFVKDKQEAILKIILVSTLIQTIWGLIQFYFIFEPGPLFWNADRGQPYGAFGQKNVFTNFIAIGSLLSIYFLFTAKRASKFWLLAAFAVVIANSHLGMLADAKTGRVVPLVALAVYLTYFMLIGKNKALCALLFSSSLVISFLPYEWFDVRHGEKTIEPSGIQSLGDRPLMYKLGFDIFMQKPIIGHGFDSTRYKYIVAHSEHLKLQGEVKDANGKMGHIHNEPLHWMIELGFISGLAFLALFIGWCVGLFKGYLDPKILLLGLPLLGQSLLEFPFYESAAHFVVFSIILGLSIKKFDHHLTVSRKYSVFVVAVFSIFGMLMTNFMLSNIATSNALVKYRQGNEQDITILNSIEPTFPFRRFFVHEQFEWKLKDAMKTGKVDQQTVFDFIDFLEIQRKRIPQSIMYVQLIELYVISGQRQKAVELVKEAKAFFPEDEKIEAYYSQI